MAKAKGEAKNPAVAPTPAPSEPRGRGRPTKYEPAFCDQARRLAMLGMTNAEMAAFFEIGDATLDRWLAEHDDFRGAVMAGRVDADARVAESLFKRAIGYSHSAVKIMQFQGSVIREEYVEHYPPDTGAATLWLKNRQGARWRDQVDMKHSGAVGVAQVEMEPDQAARVAQAILDGMKG